MTIITVISQQPLTTEQVNSFRSVPVGVNLTSSGDGTHYLADDGTYKSVSGASGTNLAIANKTSTTFDVLSSTGTDVTLPAATITEAGLLIATDKVKLNNLGTASYLNVPASGNAASGEVVKGNDTRLSDARTPTAHNHVISDVTGLQTALDGKYNNPLGDTTQYIAGDGSLIAFPVAGQAGTLVRQVRNETGSTLIKGTVVYLSGASGNKPLALRAIANSEAASDRTFGIVQADISNNSNGYAVVSGDLVGLDTSALTEGSIVYLSGTVAGGVTTTQPVSPLHSVVLGVVTRSHVTQGQFDVSIQNGFEIEDLHDVLIASKTNKDVLRYESSTGLWKNAQLATSDITGLDTALSGKQPLDNDLTAIAALAGTTGFLKKTAVDTWTLDTSTYLTGNQSITVSGDASGSGTTAITLSLGSNVVTNTKLAQIATATIKGRITAGTGAVEDLTATQAKSVLAITNSDVSGLGSLATASSVNLSTQATGTLQAAQTGALTGDVTSSAGSYATTIGTNVVGNTKLAQVATATFKGRITASTGNVEDLTATQATSLLDVFTTSSKGLVGASGGGTTNFLRADGTWAAPAGGGGGSGNAVVVDVDFGSAFIDKAQVVVTGQSWVTTTSSITCQVLCPSASDPDELYLLNIKPVVSSLVNGTGFTLTLYSEQEAKGIYKVMCVGV